jgi:hypothetical protein
MRPSRSRFSVRGMLIAVGFAAVLFSVIRWLVTEVIQPREYTYSGNQLISSRRLTSKDFEKWKRPKPWYFIEPSPAEPK